MSRRPTRLVLPLQAWLTLSHTAMLVLPVVAVVATGALASDLRGQTRDDLMHQGQVMAEMLSAALDAGDSLEGLAQGLGPRLERLRSQNLASWRVVDVEGRVLATSGDSLGESIGERDEVAEALGGQVGHAMRSRPPMSRRQSMRGPSRFADVRLFVAVPILHGGDVQGAVVLARTPREELQAFVHLGPRAHVGVLLLLVLIWVPTLAYGYLFSRSLRALARVSDRLASGTVADLHHAGLPEHSHVAETRELSRSFRVMAERLQERLSYFSEFASHVAHEFRSPLASLRGTVELLGDPEMPEAQRARFLRNASEDVARLDGMVGGLLLLARAEEGAGHEPLDLDALVRRRAETWPELVVEGHAGWVQGQAHQLQLAVDNLVANALAHGRAPVTVRLWEEGEQTGVDVVDMGPGVSEGNAPRIFDRFFTTRRGQGGHGLGLAVVRAVTRAHGGDTILHQASNPTVFRVRLPRLER